MHFPSSLFLLLSTAVWCSSRSSSNGKLKDTSKTIMDFEHYRTRLFATLRLHTVFKGSYVHGLNVKSEIDAYHKWSECIVIGWFFKKVFLHKYANTPEIKYIDISALKKNLKKKKPHTVFSKFHTKSNRAYGKHRVGADHSKAMEVYTRGWRQLQRMPFKWANTVTLKCWVWGSPGKEAGSAGWSSVGSTTSHNPWPAPRDGPFWEGSLEWR